MDKKVSGNQIIFISLGRLVVHPDNPNRMSKADFGRLKRNIKRTGFYEPIIVRPCPGKEGFYQIINGHHRCKVLAELGYERAASLVWDIDDEQADIMLTTLNRLGGSDVLDKKLVLLKRLNKRLAAEKLAGILPQTKGQIERLINLKRPALPKITNEDLFAIPMVFFLTGQQQRVVNKALTEAQKSKETKVQIGTKAQSRAAAIVRIAQFFINKSGKDKLNETG